MTLTRVAESERRSCTRGDPAQRWAGAPPPELSERIAVDLGPARAETLRSGGPAPCNGTTSGRTRTPQPLGGPLGQRARANAWGAGELKLPARPAGAPWVHPNARLLPASDCPAPGRRASLGTRHEGSRM